MSAAKPNPRRQFRVLLLSALAAAAVMTPLALWFSAATGTKLHTHFVVAMTLGITLSVMLAAVLMGLLFFSAASGHDGRVADEDGTVDPEAPREN